MAVLGLAVGGVVINPIVHGVVFLAIAVYEVDHANPAHQAARSPAVLFFDQPDRLGILLVLDAVVDDQEGCRGVFDQAFDQPPNFPRRDPVALQEVAHHVMADIFQVFGQVVAGVIDRCADQVFYVSLLCYHEA